MITMHSPIVYGNFGIDFSEIKFKAPVIIQQSYIYTKNMDSASFKVLLAFLEPEFYRESNKSIIQNKHLFDLILTWDTELLKTCSNAKKVLYGTTWINNNYVNEPKKFKLSFICGNKNELYGHKLRQQIVKIKKRLLIDSVFYRSYGSTKNLKDTIQYTNKATAEDAGKNQLFESYQYHICVENSKYENYFTEKLGDCFMTETIPIYWGCPNISEYFNPNGLFIFNSINELENIIYNLNENTYETKLEYIMENKLKYLEYANPLQFRIAKIINDNIK